MLAFLTLIAGVPVTQTALELARHDRVQFTDVLRHRPTAKRLRQFEQTLEEKSWVQQQCRPAAQRLLFQTFQDTGAKAILGRDQWLFYRPDVRCLLETGPATAPAEGNASTSRRPGSTNRLAGVVEAIRKFRDQLEERGIALVVVPIPGKPGLYPELLTRRASGSDPGFPSLARELVNDLRGRQVTAVDLFTVFAAARARLAPGAAGTEPLLYLARDTHWTPLGARLAALAVADQLREMSRAPSESIEFEVRRVPVLRWGDILEMMQIPGLRTAFPPELVDCRQVLDPVLGPLMPTASDRPGTYRYPGQKATVLVLGDSFSRIYQLAEPQSLGELPTPELGGNDRKEPAGTKRRLPGSAGFISQLALELKSPVDAIVSDGGASTDVRRKLSTNPEILEGKQVVIWEFVERDIALGAEGWEDVALPPRLDE